jgi:hypothetical protein
MARKIRFLPPGFLHGFDVCAERGLDVLRIEGTQATLEDVFDPLLDENANRDVASVGIQRSKI